MILAGDLGGTKVRLALYNNVASTLKRVKTETYESSRSASSFISIIHHFLDHHGASVEVACFGVAGPVIGGRAKITNLPWALEKDDITKQSGIKRVRLVNDLVATTAAIPHLQDGDLVTLHSGKRKTNSKIFGVLAPGTGLGTGYLVHHRGSYLALPSEGGHAAFAPTCQTEAELLKHLMSEYEHVSYEHVLSGQGLVNIYTFLEKTRGSDKHQEFTIQGVTGDPAAAISQAALNHENPLCIEALDIFVSILGAQAGNLVLTFMATGGLFLGGGIPPKIIKKLMDGTIVKSYLDKGRLAHVLQETPLYVIRDDHAALLGAASLALTFQDEN